MEVCARWRNGCVGEPLFADKQPVPNSGTGCFYGSNSSGDTLIKLGVPDIHWNSSITPSSLGA